MNFLKNHAGPSLKVAPHTLLDNTLRQNCQIIQRIVQILQETIFIFCKRQFLLLCDPSVDTCFITCDTSWIRDNCSDTGKASGILDTSWQ